MTCAAAICRPFVIAPERITVLSKIWRISETNANGFNKPACVTERWAWQRVDNFDLSWAAASGQHASSPVAHLTVTGPHGEPVNALIPQGPEYTSLTCRSARNLVLPAQPPGAKFFIGLVMRFPKTEWLRTLRVTIDGHTAVIPLTPACTSAGCFQDSPAIRYRPGTPYSHAFRI